MASLSQIYDWFMTGKKPTQAQFWATWDSFRHKDEIIPQSEITNLTSTLNAKAEKQQFDSFKSSLSNVDNTRDINKPVSTAQAAALALKLDASQYSPVSLIKEDFTFSNSQSFVLANSPTNVMSVIVNMSSLHPSQFEVSDNVLIINDTLESQDKITIAYNYSLNDTDSYTKAETDLKINQMGSAQFLGSIKPTDVPTGAGKGYWYASQAGTYTNFGGVVVGINSFAIISRNELGVFSISQTAVNLSEYVQKQDSQINLLYKIAENLPQFNVGNVFNLADYRENQTYIGTDSAPVAFQGINVVGYLPIPSGQTLELSRTDGGNVTQRIWCFDSNKKLVRTLGVNSAATNTTFLMTASSLTDVSFIGFILFGNNMPDYKSVAVVRPLINKDTVIQSFLKIPEIDLALKANPSDMYSLADHRTNATPTGPEASPATATGADYTGYIPVKSDKRIRISRKDGGTITDRVWLYSSTKTLVKVVGLSSSNLVTSVEISELDLVGVSFIGFFTKTSILPDCKNQITVLPIEGTSYRPYSKRVGFSVSLNTVNPLIQTMTSVSSVAHSELIETDFGVLLLPTTYNPIGTPTRLIIGCHGGGGTVTATTSQTETYDIYKYFVSLGYAVMDMAGMPSTMATRLKVDQFRVMGSPIAVTSYQKGYEWVIQNFNINRSGVFINGGSNGGLTALNILEHSDIPVIAMSGMSPLVDMELNAWNLSTPSISGGWATSFGNRLNIIKLYGMADPTVFEADGTTVNVSASQANLNNSVFEADKVIGFAPMLTGVWEDAGVKKKKLKAPYKIWQPIDDPAVLHSSAVTFINMLKAGGSYAILRTMDSGGHAPETAGTTLGTFVYDGQTLNLKPAAVECAQWYKRFK